MSWGLEIWDQYDHVCSHTDQGIEFVKRVSLFVEKRINVELSYARDLRKMVKQFKRKDDEDSKYSSVRDFAELLKEENDLAGQRELIAEYLHSEVLEPLRSLAKDIAAQRRKHMASGAELLRQLRASMDALDRSKRAYEKASEESENAQHALEKADNDPNSTKAKIDKLTTTLRQKENAAEESRNNYILQLEQTNQKRRQHYDTDMPQVFASLQNMNESRMNTCRELTAVFAETQRRVIPVINTCLNNITTASEAVDPKADNQKYADEVKTGYPIPGDVGFEEYQGKRGRKAKLRPKAEPKEDFSHLPPERQRKKLQTKVDELEAAISKALSDKAAMEKMQSVYTQNPQLGDVNAVTASLERTRVALGDLNTELDKYKDYLQQAKDRVDSKSSLAVQSSGAPSRYSPKAGRKVDKKKLTKTPNSEPPSISAPPAPPLPQQKGGGGHESFSESDDEEDFQTGVMLYDFDGQNEDELSANADDRLTILENLGDGWLRVKKGDDEGYVPESYVQLD